MTGQITVRIVDIIGSFLCVSAEDGQRVHDKIVPLLRENKKVVLSFAQVEAMISAFLNSAIGQLYGEFPEDLINDLVAFTEISDEDRLLLQRVVANAKTYFSNREKFDQAWKDEVGDEE